MSRTGTTRAFRLQSLWAKAIPWALESYLVRTVRAETGGSETNIPLKGALVALFAPHAGWVEPVVIDDWLRRVGRTSAVWVTKRENLAIPRVLAGDRLIFLDRQHPEPGRVRAAYQALAQPDSTVASSFEGSRFGNSDDPRDLLTLGAFKTGMVRIALRAQVPILPVVVLGVERVSPWLEETWREQGMLSAYREVRRLRASPQPVAARFLPPYRDHLGVRRDLVGRRLREEVALHTSRLRQAICAEILALEPDYPML